jgi:hypothetical protein
MGEVVTVGLDIAKSVFQVHGVDAEGQVVVQRRLTRAKLIPFFEKLPPCRVGVEACATAHHWGRRLTELGHQVKLMPPSYVKPYVKRQKNDAADAEAICSQPAEHALRRSEEPGPAGRAGDPPHAHDPDAPPDRTVEHDPGPPGGVWPGGADRSAWAAGSDRDRARRGRRASASSRKDLPEAAGRSARAGETARRSRPTG